MDFDVTDKNTWYFGSMSRQDATEVLMNERECGVFLVRDSNSIVGDYVLCVREDTKVSNYIINKIQQQDQMFYRIGDQAFENLPKLLTFYMLHYLDTTPLRRPALKRPEKVIGKFDFESNDQDDLPFRRGEVLTVLRKDEDQWWTVRNVNGQTGQIPVPYVQKFSEVMDEKTNHERPSSAGNGNGSGSIVCNNIRPARVAIVGGGIGGSVPSDTQLLANNQNQLSHNLKKSDLNRKLPAYARVMQSRVPNAYDKTALKLEVGDIITVTKTNINGQWEGELKGKKGHFPFTHVEFVENNIGNWNATNTVIAGFDANNAIVAEQNDSAVVTCHSNSTELSGTSGATRATPSMANTTQQQPQTNNDVGGSSNSAGVMGQHNSRNGSSWGE